MSQEYTVNNWSAWEDEEGPIRDQHGNFKGSVWFDESEKQVDATFKTQPAKGDKKYGDIVEYTTKAGKTRLKFQRADRPMEQQTSFGGNAGATKNTWQPRDDDRIAAQWALGRSYERNGATEVAIKEAKWLFASLDRVKATLPELPPRTAKQQDKDEDKEMAGLLDQAMNEPVNLDDIPF